MTGSWFLDVNTMHVGIALWVVAVVAYGGWRSRGEAAVDPIRPSGPIFS